MIYLNNASTSYPKPNSVINAVNDYLSHIPVLAHRSGIDSESDDIITQARKNLAKVLGTKHFDRIFFTPGSTFSLNMALKGLDFEGKHFIATEIEHNAIVRPLETLKSQNLIEVDYARSDSKGFIDPNEIKRLIKNNTKAIFINHCSNVTGTLQDLKSISKICKENNVLLIVDASQSTGAVEFSIDEIEPDILCFTGHKSLFGLQGSGGIYIRPGFEINPLIQGGTGVLSEITLQPEEPPHRYESGTMNIPGIIAMNEGAKWILDKGIKNISSHKSVLIDKIVNYFQDDKDISIYSDSEYSSKTVFTFNVKEMVPEEVNFLLQSSFDIVSRSGLHCAPLIRKPIGAYPYGTVRVSPSYFTTEKEIDILIEAIKTAKEL